MRAQAFRRDERSLEVRAEDVRGGAVLRQLAERRGQVLLSRRDERGLERGHSRAEESLAGAAIAVRVRREEIDPAEPVHLQVDEPGGGDPVAFVAVHADRGDASVGDLDVARQELSADERRLDAEPSPPRHASAHRRGRHGRLGRRNRRAALEIEEVQPAHVQR